MATVSSSTHPIIRWLSRRSGTLMLQRGSVSQFGKLMRRVFLTALEAKSCWGSQLEAGKM